MSRNLNDSKTRKVSVDTDTRMRSIEVSGVESKQKSVDSGEDSGAESRVDRLKVNSSRNHTSRRSSHHSTQEAINNCPQCKGKTLQRPCQEYVDILREEFKIHIESLFANKMRDFIAFIEETVTLEDQVDVEKDHIIHAFYREHNSLNKMHDNLRLMEYKRKVYAEKKKQKSNSPERERARL